MKTLRQLFENNRIWAEKTKAGDPDFFHRLARQQSPKYLWIGCSDSRVPANQIVGLPAGEIFVHRNVGNIVVHTDFNCLSVIQYAIEVLKIEHIIVCGHYGCGGVQAALRNGRLGLIDNWLTHIKDVLRKHSDTVKKIENEQDLLSKLCELNVIEQVRNVCNTTIVQNAWNNRSSLSVHGWIYAIEDGIIRDLNVCVTDPKEIDSIYNKILQEI